MFIYVFFQLKFNEVTADQFISELIFKVGTRHYGYGCYIESLELHGVIMVKALVKICLEQENGKIASKETTEALFIFMKVINYWLTQGLKYVHGKGRDY